MSRRLVILTEIIAPYRIPVFNALARHEGINLHVIFLAENDPALRQWQVYKDEIRFSYEVLRSTRLRLGRHKILLNRGLKTSLRRANPDAIVCGGYNYVASWQTRSWALKKHVPFLLWAESTESDQRNRTRIIEFMKSRFMRGCSAFVVPGKSSFNYLKSYGVVDDDIFTAPNAVDTELFARRADVIHQEAATHREALHLPARFFLFVGRLVREKGVFDLLTAYGKLSPGLREKIGLVFVGDGEARAELERRSTEILPGRIYFAGFSQREQLAGYYALADLFVFPSHSDTWGLVVNEAMACGLAVICTDVAGCVADLVTQDWNGCVVRSRDVNQLADSMEALGSDPDLLSRMGNHSRERILQYSPETCAAGIANAVLPGGVRHHG
jgi:glycosyltransferase involved in cell wall biosynthesis